MGFLHFLSDPITFLANWLQGLLLGVGIPAGIVQFILFVIGAGALATAAMMFVIFLIWLERKAIARLQDRLGPNRVGPWGIFQTIPDMIKIFTKEFITPTGADIIPYNLAPILAVAGVLMVWSVIPLAISVVGMNLNVGVLYIIAVGSLGELGIIMAGFGSNNKFALLGGFRAVALLVSYEVPMVISLLVPVMLAGSMGMTDIAQAQNVWYIWLTPAAALIFLITSIAENGRAPFDLTEADSEIVAGFNIEYSGLKFGMFYVADFLHSFTIAMVFSVLFLGGWRGPGAEQIPILGFIYLMIKAGLIEFLIIWIRGSLPRFRIDQMMDVNWKVLTPLSLSIVVVTAVLDKLIPVEQTVFRIFAFLVVNLAVLLITGWLIEVFKTRRPRPVVSKTQRPVARPENVAANSNSGD
ncbi:MAG TPA: NADH-quinone oxidoreductase subunit NuoH [Anaerolineaceae bacterium]|nr:NADH-quinone oxidoreductase subunit NuoH [Anaerolineaceae bacterium]